MGTMHLEHAVNPDEAMYLTVELANQNSSTALQFRILSIKVSQAILLWQKKSTCVGPGQRETRRHSPVNTLFLQEADRHIDVT